MSKMNAQLEKIKSGLALPAIAAPMFLVSNPETVIAACKAGVIGFFPGPNARTGDDLRDWLTQITNAIRPNDAPWAFNMITHSSYGRFEVRATLTCDF
jgi:nitronate monooxygenase